MAKRFEKEIELYKAKNELRFTLGVLVCTLLTTCLLIVSAFTVIHISHYYIPLAAILHPIAFANTQHAATEFIMNFSYVPQIPAIAFMTTIIGRKYGTISVILYILIGIFLFPVFSLGGGWRYIFQYGFGYLLGFFPMIFILAHFIKDDLKPKKVFIGAILSILSLHIVGMAYLILICAIRHEPFAYVQDLLKMMTFVKIIYDIITTIVCIYLANITKKILWLAMD